MPRAKVCLALAFSAFQVWLAKSHVSLAKSRVWLAKSHVWRDFDDPPASAPGKLYAGGNGPNLWEAFGSMAVVDKSDGIRIGNRYGPLSSKAAVRTRQGPSGYGDTPFCLGRSCPPSLDFRKLLGKYPTF